MFALKLRWVWFWPLCWSEYFELFIGFFGWSKFASSLTENINNYKTIIFKKLIEISPQLKILCFNIIIFYSILTFLYH